MLSSGWVLSAWWQSKHRWFLILWHFINIQLVNTYRGLFLYLVSGFELLFCEEIQWEDNKGFGSAVLVRWRRAGCLSSIVEGNFVYFSSRLRCNLQYESDAYHISQDNRPLRFSCVVETPRRNYQRTWARRVELQQSCWPPLGSPFYEKIQLSLPVIGTS